MTVNSTQKWFFLFFKKNVILFPKRKWYTISKKKKLYTLTKKNNVILPIKKLAYSSTFTQMEYTFQEKENVYTFPKNVFLFTRKKWTMHFCISVCLLISIPNPLDGLSQIKTSFFNIFLFQNIMKYLLILDWTKNPLVF